jgi:hypothetical protein
MEQEATWYHTTTSSCDCGETIHLSVIYGTQMPCSHQYYLGVEKPSVPSIFNVSLIHTWENCILDVVKIDRHIPDESPTHFEYVRDITIRNIKRFSKSKKKDEIRRYVDENLIMGEEFALGLPISLLNLISQGIQQFSQ